MNFEEYARMNEQFLEMTPTQMVNVVDRTNFDGCSTLHHPSDSLVVISCKGS